MNNQGRREARIEKIKTFGESAVAAVASNIFGLPFSVEESEVVLIPVPWDVTVSFRPGTAKGPAAIREASRQVDLFYPEALDAWKYGFAMKAIDTRVEAKALQLRTLAVECIRHLEAGGSIGDADVLPQWNQVNQGGLYLSHYVKRKALLYLRQDKIVGVVGGDHSVPLGLMQALDSYYDSYGILHIDAHLDHRDAYEGFRFSHASIMRNASHIQGIKKIVHVGIRDYCAEEAQFVKMFSDRFIICRARDLKDNQINHRIPWYSLCHDMIRQLPQHVYVSFDIDGLDPSLCPDTGTPVPDGLSFWQACTLLECLVQNGHKIIGFDLCEVAPNPSCNDFAADWNANVGSRILYTLCSLAATSVRGQWRE